VSSVSSVERSANLLQWPPVRCPYRQRSLAGQPNWSRGDLIYTGRGKRGDQKLEGANRDLAENRYENFVFEGGVGSEVLRFLGTARATRQWRARGPDDDRTDREILRYRLRFQSGGAAASASQTRRRPATTRRTQSAAPAQKERQRRRFDPGRPPGQYRKPVQNATPEETAARREKANQAHHALLVRLQAGLAALRWSDFDEIPSAIDLEAQKGGRKILFEAKTVSPRSELSQTRSGLSQLLEYRFFYGEPSDRLCLVTNGPISDRRIRFLEAEGIAVAYEEGNGVIPCGTLAQRLLT
jgi:hypothetical protein